ncbi:MAG: hypothetical protein A2Y07_00435 [Planctomycetes bacterium GWF2_50_10]|nr:MAG: hypothetical protein A2Y07_00435 [Planctomycetes bacterium GWF2_50_10]
MGAIVWVLFFCTWAGAILNHPGYEPPAELRPNNEVVGVWSYNASFCVISPKWIITTRHQNTFPDNNEITIGNKKYKCIYSPKWVGGPAGNSDIRLIRLRGTDGTEPNLKFAPAYEGPEDEIGKEMAAGGCGVGWAENKYDNENRPYGYIWGGNNRAWRWCTNKIEWAEDANTLAGYTSAIVRADFDGIGIEGTGYTDYEGVCAMYDSGSGWFIQVGNEWKLVGVTRSVAHFYDGQNRYSLFANPGSKPNRQDPYLPAQRMDAVRVSTYAGWINSIISEDCGGIDGDLNGPCSVDMGDFAQLAKKWLVTGCAMSNNFCGGADVNRDAYVNLKDVYLMCINWLESSENQFIIPVP